MCHVNRQPWARLVSVPPPMQIAGCQGSTAGLADKAALPAQPISANTYMQQALSILLAEGGEEVVQHKADGCIGMEDGVMVYVRRHSFAGAAHRLASMGASPWKKFDFPAPFAPTGKCADVGRWQ